MDTTAERFWWSFGMGVVSAVITAIGTHGDEGLIAMAFVVAALITAVLGPTLVGFFTGDSW